MCLLYVAEGPTRAVYTREATTPNCGCCSLFLFSCVCGSFLYFGPQAIASSLRRCTAGIPAYICGLCSLMDCRMTCWWFLLCGVRSKPEFFLCLALFAVFCLPATYAGYQGRGAGTAPRWQVPPQSIPTFTETFNRLLKQTLKESF